MVSTDAVALSESISPVISISAVCRVVGGLPPQFQKRRAFARAGKNQVRFDASLFPQFLEDPPTVNTAARTRDSDDNPQLVPTLPYRFMPFGQHDFPWFCAVENLVPNSEQNTCLLP